MIGPVGDPAAARFEPPGSAERLLTSLLSRYDISAELGPSLVLKISGLAAHGVVTAVPVRRSCCRSCHRSMMGLVSVVF